MRFSKMAAMLVFIFLGFGLCADNLDYVFGAVSEEEAVRQVIVSALDGLEKGDIEKFMQDFSKKEFLRVVMSGPDKGKALSYEEFKKDLESYDNTRLILSITNREVSEIKVEGSEASVKVRFSQSVIRFSDNKIKVLGKSRAISLKKQDGKWKITSWDDLPIAKAAPEKKK